MASTLARIGGGTRTHGCSILLPRAHSPRSTQNEAARTPPLSSSFPHPVLIRTTTPRRSSVNSTAVFAIATLRAYSHRSTQMKTVIIPPPSSSCPYIPASQSHWQCKAVDSHRCFAAPTLPTTALFEANTPRRHTQCPRHCPYAFPILSCSHHPATRAGRYHCLFCPNVHRYISFNSFICPEL